MQHYMAIQKHQPGQPGLHLAKPCESDTQIFVNNNQLSCTGVVVNRNGCPRTSVIKTVKWWSHKKETLVKPLFCPGPVNIIAGGIDIHSTRLIIKGLIVDEVTLKIWITSTGYKYNNPLQWRHNECDGVSNQRRLDCLLYRVFWRRSKKTSLFRVTGLCEGEFTFDRLISRIEGQ